MNPQEMGQGNYSAMVDLIEAGLWSNDNHLHGGDSVCVCVCVCRHVCVYNHQMLWCIHVKKKNAEQVSEETEKEEKQTEKSPNTE